MVKKLASYKTLTGRKKAAKANPKIAALQVELAHVDSGNFRVCPVSYTHLDVYKRQAPHNALGLTCGFACMSPPPLAPVFPFPAHKIGRAHV